MEDYMLVHHGIKGQKWGVRRFQNQDGSLTDAGKRRYNTGTIGSQTPDNLKTVSKSTLKQAKKDAKEAAEAKMYYGEGAGNRRKLIKNAVEQRSNDPDYKKAYEYYYSQQDMAKAADKAKAKRTRIDTYKEAKRVVRLASTITATAATAYYIAHQAGIDKIIADMAKTAIKTLR